MKILVVTQYFWPEEFRVNDLVKGLVERGHDVTVFTALPNYPFGKLFAGHNFFKGPYSETYINKVKVIRTPIITRGASKGIRLILNYLSFMIIGALTIPFRCRDHYDRIFVYEVSPITVVFPAIILKFFRRIPIYFWVTDLWPESLVATKTVNSKFILKMVSKMVKFFYRQSDVILVSGKGFVDKISKFGVSADKVKYFPQWAEPIFSKRVCVKENNVLEYLPKGIKILFAGNIGVAQSLDTIVDAAEKLKHISNLHWVILGDGNMKKWVEQEVKDRNLQGTFHLIGRVPMKEVPYYYAAADFLLISLRNDPLFQITVPAKVQTCLASGKPILATIGGEAKNIIEEAKCGFVVSPEDGQALADAAENLLTLDKNEIEELGKNAAFHFKNNFEREMLLSELENIMDIYAGPLVQTS